MTNVRTLAEDLYFIEQPMGDTFTGITVIVGKEIAVVDTGLPSSAQDYIFPLVRRLGRQLDEIHLVVNTHCHEDHIGSNGEIQRACGAEIAAHRREIPWIEDVQAQQQDLWGLFPEYHPVERGHDKSHLNSKVDVELTDGQTLLLGDRLLEVLHCPGHSPGSICLYDRKNALLLSGDSVQGHGSAHAGMAMVLDLDGYAASLRTLASHPIRRLIMDHPYRPFAEQAVLDEGEASEFLAESARILSRYLLTLFDLFQNTPEGMTLVEVRDFLTREFGGGQKTIQAMLTTAVMLQRMSEQGLIHRTEEGLWCINNLHGHSTSVLEIGDP